MGTIQHTAVLATALGDENFKKIEEYIEKNDSESFLISDVKINGFKTYILVPNGSKLGWEEANRHNSMRADFIKFIDSLRYSDGSSPVDYIEVSYGELGSEIMNTTRVG